VDGGELIFAKNEEGDDARQDAQLLQWNPRGDTDAGQKVAQKGGREVYIYILYVHVAQGSG